MPSLPGAGGYLDLGNLQRVTYARSQNRLLSSKRSLSAYYRCSFKSYVDEAGRRGTTPFDIMQDFYLIRPVDTAWFRGCPAPTSQAD